ncbi:MAG: class I SAM-dependent methyltransferase [Candidatus Omnitrophica bacterium]|nr:class I SAM-dependent methyltransferase [Candidatus Omnitrophota bacterium]
MGRIAFENFGIAAERADNFTIAASRYLQQEKEEKYIVWDIINKLNITTHDDCLDIGCGTGNILIPLSSFTNTITGIDHFKCLKRLKERIDKNQNIRLIPGNFLDLNISRKFDKIIIYSVIQYLANKKEVLKFVNKAMHLLKPKGKLLVGDLPNISKEKRFLNSKKGKAIYCQWKSKRAKIRRKVKIESIGDVLKGVARDKEYVNLDDNLALSILSRARKNYFDAYILPQSSKLPFGYFREDILIENNQ